ncbi:MAG TPA: deoxyribose-phosphate aldolase [Flavisolibacter sp.]|nr:deoxyribose-phosphate aldolase [Flavisolibacter sp.]
MSIAQFIDHTILKPTTTLADIEKICEEAVQYHFAAVCIPPYYVRDAKQILDKSPIKTATVVGFPFGYSHYKAKLSETKQALNDGADEIDMVMNLAAFKSNDLAYLESEIKEVTDLVKSENAVFKLIIESGILSDEEIIKCCELYKHFPIDFLKTSTGYAEKGATVEAVALMRKHLPANFQIKASGGIRSYEFAKQLIDAGATRLGCSASIAIVKGETVSGNGY